MDHVNWPRTRDILISTVCIGIISWAIWNIAGVFVEVIVILLLSMAVAFLLTPAVNNLVKNGMPRVIATLLVYIVVLAVLGGLGYALTFSLINQVLAFRATVETFFGALPDTVISFERFLHERGGIPDANINQAVDQIRNQALGFAQSAAGSALNIVLILTNAFINILLVTVLSFYLTLDGKRVRDSIVSIIPRRSMPHALLFEDALNRVVGNYIRGQLTLAAIIGVMAGLVCIITGLGNFALIIGVLAFLFETIPMVGPALASIPALLLSLLLPDPFPRTLYVGLWFVAIQMIESNILGPRIVGHAVGLHPVASILALLAGARLFGAFGALLATPIVAAIWVVVASIYHSARGETADQMLASKRASWTIRRPNLAGPLPKLRRRSDDGRQTTIPARFTPLPKEQRPVEVGKSDRAPVDDVEDGRRVVSTEKPAEVPSNQGNTRE